MSKQLKPLHQHEFEARLIHEMDARNGDRQNGIACPKCGAELVDTDPSVSLTSDPPQKRIACRKCDYTGYRTA